MNVVKKENLSKLHARALSYSMGVTCQKTGPPATARSGDKGRHQEKCSDTAPRCSALAANVFLKEDAHTCPPRFRFPAQRRSESCEACRGRVFSRLSFSSLPLIFRAAAFAEKSKYLPHCTKRRLLFRGGTKGPHCSVWMLCVKCEVANLPAGMENLPDSQHPHPDSANNPLLPSPARPPAVAPCSVRGSSLSSPRPLLAPCSLRYAAGAAIGRARRAEAQEIRSSHSQVLQTEAATRSHAGKGPVGRRE